MHNARQNDHKKSNHLAQDRDCSGRTVYKCIHADGRIEYSALPIATAECETIAGMAPVSPPPTQETSTEAEPSEVELTPRQRNCQQAMQNLTILESQDRVAVTDMHSHAGAWNETTVTPSILV